MAVPFIPEAGMRTAKKLLSVMLAAVLVFQAGAFTVFAKSAENKKRIITISDIDTSQLTGKSGESSTKIETEGYNCFKSLAPKNIRF